MKVPALFAALFLVQSLAAAVVAERLADVQVELKKQGFYFGEVDGKSSDETKAAIRRFQIRHGLKVTGDVTDETLATLGIGGEKPAEPPKPEAEPPKPPKPTEQPRQINPPEPGKTPEPPPPPPQSPKQRDLLVRERDREPMELPQPRGGLRQPLPPDSSVIEPPREIPNAVNTVLSAFYQGTPFSNAPQEVQEDTLAAAQRMLQRMRLYRGEVDGYLGALTSEALFRFQELNRLPRTGRLDLETLARMNLLPRVVPAPGSPFYNPNKRRDRTVDSGFRR